MSLTNPEIAVLIQKQDHRVKWVASWSNNATIWAFDGALYLYNKRHKSVTPHHETYQAYFATQKGTYFSRGPKRGSLPVEG